MSEGVLVTWSRFLLLGLIRAAFSFGRLTSETERRFTIRHTGRLGDYTRSRLGTTVEFAFDVTGAIELL